MFPVARRPSEEMEIDRICSLSSITGPICVRVDVSKSKTDCRVTVAMNLPLAARAMEWTESSPSWRICDSTSWSPVDTLKDLILLPLDAVKICWPSLDHANGVIPTPSGTTAFKVVTGVTVEYLG